MCEWYGDKIRTGVRRDLSQFWGNSEIRLCWEATTQERKARLHLTRVGSEFSHKQGRKVKRSQKVSKHSGFTSAEGIDLAGGGGRGKTNMQYGKDGCDHVTKICQIKLCSDCVIQRGPGDHQHTC